MLGCYLKQIRLKDGLTLEEMAERLGLSRYVLTGLEKGKPFTDDHINRLCSYLNKSLKEIQQEILNFKPQMNQEFKRKFAVYLIHQLESKNLTTIKMAQIMLLDDSIIRKATRASLSIDFVEKYAKSHNMSVLALTNEVENNKHFSFNLNFKNKFAQYLKNYSVEEIKAIFNTTTLMAQEILKGNINENLFKRYALKKKEKMINFYFTILLSKEEKEVSERFQNRFSAFMRKQFTDFNLNAKAIAAKSNLSASTVLQLCDGKFSYTTYEKICRFLNINSQKLYEKWC